MKIAIRFTVFFIVTIALIFLTFIKTSIGIALIVLGLLGIGIYDILQTKRTILRNFPIIGHMRFLLESISPELHQYFIEGNTKGKPISRNVRTYVYARAKLENENHPFGTELNVNEENYIWMRHSIYAGKRLSEAPRNIVGNHQCSAPYSASLFNISAMSFGALSKNAISALNLGAKQGGFMHDTGEGGISPYHLLGGDLVYQVGTGYFGCRTPEGKFSAENFAKTVNIPQVKMISLKLSQGAKPGHGGILPASKNNDEIAKIRGVKPHTTIFSPPSHTAFSNPIEMMEFIAELRRLSGGKPVGFKLAIGSKKEFIDICEAIIQTGIIPDFITVDGAEGGTGAAPLDFTDHVGMPWEEALCFVVDTLRGYDLKKHIKVITATRIFTAFDIFKALCIGADITNSARGMMLAIGCIQALKCHTNECPTGVATNNARLVNGLVITEKDKRVYNYHQRTISDFMDLLSAAGCQSIEDVSRDFIYKKLHDKTYSFQEIYPDVEIGSLLKTSTTN
ncbi:FMN-binding glutamate synthase family protein [Myroides sp. LJL115]